MNDLRRYFELIIFINEHMESRPRMYRCYMDRDSSYFEAELVILLTSKYPHGVDLIKLELIMSGIELFSEKRLFEDKEQTNNILESYLGIYDLFKMDTEDKWQDAFLRCVSVCRAGINR